MENEESNTFKSLKERVSSATLKAVKKMGFLMMTDIQAEVIPKALDGADVVATAKTGSGKTLAFLVPCVEMVKKNILETSYGSCTYCIVISPTRELATQTYTVLQNILSYHEDLSCALIIGGENRKKQLMELAKGIHIVVATPGRLFDHMRTTEFDYKHVNCLVLDEADKIFQYGFEEDLKQIIGRLPTNRQTMLFSATLSDRTEALIKSAMKANLEEIQTGQDDLRATVEGLKQGYVICETEYRMWWLQKLLKKTQKQKVMVFFSSCKSVVFHHEFFSAYCQIPVLCIHGKMNQSDRTSTMEQFYSRSRGVLLCTDVAARGLDIPRVEWVVQFDPPADTNEYIHRVGRTARGKDAVGNAVLLLRPEEQSFISHLQEAKIFLDKFETWDSFYNLQPKIDEALKNKEFYKLAVEALEGYIRALEVRKLKDVFNVVTINMQKVAKSFGLNEVPDIDVHTGFSKKHRPRKRMVEELSERNSIIKQQKVI